MKCLQCLTENKNTARHCEKCGAPLPARRLGDLYRKRIIFTVITALMVLVGGIAYLSRDLIAPDVQLTEIISPVEEKDHEKERREKREALKAKLRAEMKERPAVPVKEVENAGRAEVISPREQRAEKKVIAGWVLITDPGGRQVHKFRAGLAGNGWLALPARACLGGSRWHFSPDSGQVSEISGGLWTPGDKVGLWHLAEGEGSFDGPELSPWDDRAPVSWSSLESANGYDSIRLNPGRAAGFFVPAFLPEYIDETGIFMQGGKIVGWSFGRLLPKGHMWQGRAGADLTYKTWVRYFYNITFANGREEKFAQSLAMQKGYTGLDRLASFIDGFRLQPKLAAEDTPPYLMPEEIIRQMHVLITNAVNNGDGGRVAELLSGQVLKRIGDISILMDVVPAIVQARGFEAAVTEIEDSGRYITRQMGHDIPGLNALHMKLYQDWLQSLVSTGAVDEGLQTYGAAKAHYPDDPYIHLLGVELTLLGGDWQEAERLLHMRNYPQSFQDRYHLLSLRIAEMKGQEGKIVIRFPRGSGTIPVTASVNGTQQDFLVDTGASVVTIPSSMADSLGLEVVHRHRKVSTAGGVVTAREVIIDEIEIEGWTEYDVRAYVLDLPGRPGLGLLGLSYLGRFRMDLKTEEGILLLTPR